MRFCSKCGASLTSAAPSPGGWQQPSGNLYETPPAGDTWSQQQQPGPGAYMPPSAPPPYGYPQGMGGPVGMNYAMWGDRVLAALIDGAIIFALIIVLYIVIGVVGGVLSGAAGSVSDDLGGLVGSTWCCTFILLPALASLGVGIYNKVYLLTKRGSSIGQHFMKLKVVDANGNLLQTGTAVLRLLVQMGLGMIPIVGWLLTIINLLFPLWDPQRQTLHDKAVGSFVIKTGA
jgi:uncharacterized RDD family membrane protein YckC